MFRYILPAVLAIVALSGCSVYRSGQTPDDVYYSPGRSEDSYVTVDNTKSGSNYGRNSDYYNPDDNYLRMRVRDPYRWSTLDNYYYMNDWQYSPGYYGAYSPYASYYSPYSWYSPYSFNAYWSSYYYWNSFYNPYSPSIIVVSPKNNPVVYNRVRNISVGSYINNGYNTRNAGAVSRNNSLMYRSASPSNNNARYNNSNSSLGGSIRKAFSGSNNNNGSYYTPSSSSSDRPMRTYTPSSSSGSSSGSRSGGGSSGGSSGGGGGGVTRPGRG